MCVRWMRVHVQDSRGVPRVSRQRAGGSTAHGELGAEDRNCVYAWADAVHEGNARLVVAQQTQRVQCNEVVTILVPLLRSFTLISGG